MNSEINSAVL